MPDRAIFTAGASIADALGRGGLRAAAAGAAKILPSFLLVPFFVAPGDRIARGRSPR